MPTYRFHCMACQVDHEDIVPISKRDESQDCPECGKSGTAVRVFEPTEAMIVPPWMSAQGSHASERQAKYLKSDRHRQAREKAEKMQDKYSALDQKYENFKKHDLPDRVAKKKAQAKAQLAK